MWMYILIGVIVITLIYFFITYNQFVSLKNNVEELKTKNINFLNPFLPFEAKQLVKTVLNLPEFAKYNFTKK